jgi:DnaJ-class molecular chaperone
MIKLKSAIKEKHCSACGGMGVAKTKQSAAPGRRIYAPQCEECGGKGRITADGGSAEE